MKDHGVHVIESSVTRATPAGKSSVPNSQNRSGRVRAGSVQAEVRRGLDVVHPAKVLRICREHGTSPGVARSVLVALGEAVSWKHGDTFLMVRTLAKRTGWKKRTVQRGMAALIALGVVQRVRGEKAWRVYVPELGLSADRRRSAYHLTEWRDRMGLQERGPLPEMKLTEYRLRSTREQERTEREHAATVRNDFARKAADRLGIEWTSVYCPPQAGGELARRAARAARAGTMGAASPPRDAQPVDSGAPSTPSYEGNSSSKGTGPLQPKQDGNAFLESYTRFKEARGGAPPRIPPLRR